MDSRIGPSSIKEEAQVGTNINTKRQPYIPPQLTIIDIEQIESGSIAASESDSGPAHAS